MCAGRWGQVYSLLTEYSSVLTDTSLIPRHTSARESTRLPARTSPASSTPSLTTWWCNWRRSSWRSSSSRVSHSHSPELELISPKSFQILDQSFLCYTAYTHTHISCSIINTDMPWLVTALHQVLPQHDIF